MTPERLAELRRFAQPRTDGGRQLMANAYIIPELIAEIVRLKEQAAETCRYIEGLHAQIERLKLAVVDALRDGVVTTVKAMSGCK